MRQAQFSNEQIIEAATKVVVERGPSGASIANIAKATGAPTGSIYHRFTSRNAVLGEVWLKAAEAYQAGFLELLYGFDQDPIENDELILYTPNRVRRNLGEARILMVHRREEFLSADWPRDIQARAQRLIAQFSEGHRYFCERICGRCNERTLSVVRYAVASAPVAAVKPYIERNQEPPALVDELVRETFRATVALIGVTR